MKKDTEKILYSLEAEDLGPLLDVNYGEKTTKEQKSELYKKVRNKTGLAKMPVSRSRLIAAVIAAALVISLLLGGYAYALDVKEYNEAVAYLSSIEYPTDGMSRGEIKKIYRAIVASAPSDLFEEGENEVRVEITGFDMGAISAPAETGGITYEIPTVQKSGVNHYYLQKNDGNTVLWTYSKDNGIINGYYPVSGGKVAVCGSLYRDGTGNPNGGCQFFALLDENGQTVWENVCEIISGADFDYASEYAAGIFEKEDGSFFALGFIMTMIGDDVETYLSLTEISESGDILNKKDIPTTGYFGGKHFVGLRYCTRFDDGFIAFLVAHGSNRFEGLVKISPNGEIGQVFGYGEEGFEYIVTDIAECGGRLFISADAIRPDSGSGSIYSSARTNLLSAPLNSLVNSDGADLLPHDCTGVIKEACEAVLLAVDPDSEEPRTYYRESGALAGGLGIDDTGRLVWATKSIAGGIAHNRLSGSQESPYKFLEVIYSYSEYSYTFEKDGRSAVKTLTDTVTGEIF